MVGLVSLLVVSTSFAAVAPFTPAHAASTVVSGVVLDVESGQPLAGVMVLDNKTCTPNTPTSTPDCTVRGILGDSTVTDDTGHYTLADDKLGMGYHVIGFYDPQGYYEPTYSVLGETTSTVDVRLHRNGYGPVLKASSLPAIIGSVKAGATLVVRPAVWNVNVTTLDHTWRVDGSVVGTGDEYVVQQRDLGHRITVTARVWARGAALTTATSAPAAVVPVIPATVSKVSTKLTVRAHHPRHTRTVRLAVMARANGTTPTGTVRIYRDRRLLQTVTLVEGRASVRLTRQPSGKQRYRIAYAGTATLLGTTATVGVRV